jgi:hypothetical protein
MKPQKEDRRQKLPSAFFPQPGFDITVACIYPTHELRKYILLAGKKAA